MTLHVGSVGPPIRANTMEPEVFRQGIYALAEGRVGVVGSTDMAVTQNGTPNMSVNVAAGQALVTGTSNVPVQGTYNAYNDASANIALAASNATNPRIDIICLTINDAYYGSANNTPLLQAITGVPGASPAVPATPANSLVLAHVYVGAAVTSIVTAAINSTAGAGNPDTIAFTPGRCVALQAFATGSGGTITSIASPGVLIPGLTVNVNAGANRNLRVRFAITLSDSATTVVDVAEVYRDGTGGTALSASFSLVGVPATAGYVTLAGEVYDQPAAGMHSYAVYAYSTGANTQTYTVGRGTLSVKDAGPV